MTPEQQLLSRKIWDALSGYNDDYMKQNTMGDSFINFIKEENSKAAIKAIEYTILYMENHKDG